MHKPTKYAISLHSAIIALIVLTLPGCEKADDSEQIAYPLETARMVSNATSGVISAGDQIRVRFVAEMIDENLVGQTLKKTVFQFEPSIPGVAEWTDRRTLSLKPSRPLELREKYSGELDLATLFPKHKEAELQPLVIRFEVAGREIQSVDINFSLVDKNDPSRLVYEGNIALTEKTELSVVQRASSFKLNAASLSLDWSAGADEKTFHFTSDAVTRDSEKKKLEFRIKKDPLDISQDYVTEILLTPLSDLAVVKIEKKDQGEKPVMEIEFTDELDPAQDIAGLITLDPSKEIKLTVSGKTATVRGNLQYGQDFAVQIHPGIRSRWGTATKELQTHSIQLEDLKPRIRFSSRGVFLPSANRQIVRFQTLNLRTVQLEIKKVFESNLGQFLQTERLGSQPERNESFNDYYVDRVGVVVAKDALQIGDTRNKWLQHELDLKKLIEPGEKGLFLVHLEFRQEDMLYGTQEELEEKRRTERFYGEDYYSSPYSPGYIHTHGKIYKPIIVSDIGLSNKRSYQHHLVYATDILDASPLSGVSLNLRTYQNQIIASKTTDAEGKAEFENVGQEVFYVEAEKSGQRSLIELNEMDWNLSTFDTGGESVPPGGTRAFIYTERGVYRPGDEINLSVIARNENGTFPDNHPVNLKLFNPKNQLILEQTQREGTDGFYSFQLATKAEDLTGNWRARITAGSRTFDHPLKIETVVPFRLKVHIEPEKDRLGPNDKILRLTVRSTYLFGTPAAGLNAEVDIALNKLEKTFPQFEEFTFSNKTIDYTPVSAVIHQGKLDAEGKAQIEWTIPQQQETPSAINALVRASILERGGRANRNWLAIPIDPYERYVGLRIPQFEYGYARLGAPLEIPVVVVDVDGNASAGHTLDYRIYRNSTNWWWEYESRSEFRLRFRSNTNTELLEEGTLISQNLPAALQFTPDDRGEYLIEVADASEGGHMAAFFLRAYAWGGPPSGAEDAGQLVLKSDKNKYAPGETANITFPTPKEGAILVSLEKGSRIMSSFWQQPDPNQFETNVQVSITEEMLPNAYASVSIIQPHAQTANDRPIRMYGVIPLFVEEPKTRQEVKIIMPDELGPKKEFEVRLETADQTQTQFTLAVVDEGLLDLTRFKTPDPWQAFFKKQRLDVVSSDLFSFVIGANKGDVFKTFSIGGDLAEMYRESQLPPERAKRFPPVALFEGPVLTDSDGHASVTFEMPDYIGSVRVMAISARGDSYGSAEKTVPVKSDLMILPSLPRILGAGDRVSVPVTVFAMRDQLGDVTVAMDVVGPVTSLGENSKSVNFLTSGEKDVLFELAADAAVGIAEIKFTAKSAAFIAESQTEIDVRASSPRIYDSEELELTPGNSAKMAIPDRGIPGSNNASLSIRRRPNLNIDHRLNWLIRYPYGCIEQLTSAVFPQLYLKTIMTESRNTGQVIDENINSAIMRLRKFQLPSGAFSYWPGNRQASEWGSNYAGHFLIEARNLGYSVPADLLDNWLRYQRSQALTTRENLMVRVYRVYLLALAGSPQIGPMNLLKENNLKDMIDTEKWLLASAYQMAGVDRAAQEMLRTTGKQVKDYQEFSGTYGSGLRDLAIILDQLVFFERWDEADELAKQLSAALSTRDWYSTQTTGFMLLAVGKYLQEVEGKAGDRPRLVGEIRPPDGQKIQFDTEDIGYTHEFEEGFGEQVEVYLDGQSAVNRSFVSLNWDGVPLKSDAVDESKNLELIVTWLDEDGMSVDPTNMKQGTAFWTHFEIKKPESQTVSIEELALVQVLPAGWEVENIRLSGEDLPGWMSGWNLNREEYLDIRDDRVMWFFDFPRQFRRRRGRDERGNVLDFAVKLNAVTVGEFTLPPIVVEAMYNDQFRAVKAGGTAVVSARGN
jgi:uncharacterized protein YfaS (alpha-2-macroglobulin family)